jgi:hypothetical protein
MACPRPRQATSVPRPHVSVSAARRMEGIQIPTSQRSTTRKGANLHMHLTWTGASTSRLQTVHAEYNQARQLTIVRSPINSLRLTLWLRQDQDPTHRYGSWISRIRQKKRRKRHRTIGSPRARAELSKQVKNKRWAVILERISHNDS